MAALHDLNLVLRFATKVVVLDRGVVTATGDPASTLVPELIARVFGVRASRATRADCTSVLAIDGIATSKS